MRELDAKEIAESAYRTAMYSVVIAIFYDMSIEDMKWLLPKVIDFVEQEEKWRNRK